MPPFISSGGHSLTAARSFPALTKPAASSWAALACRFTQTLSLLGLTKKPCGGRDHATTVSTALCQAGGRSSFFARKPERNATLSPALLLASRKTCGRGAHKTSPSRDSHVTVQCRRVREKTEAVRSVASDTEPSSCRRGSLDW